MISILANIFVWVFVSVWLPVFRFLVIHLNNVLLDRFVWYNVLVICCDMLSWCDILYFCPDCLTQYFLIILV